MRQYLLKQMTWEDVKEIVNTALNTPFNEPTPEDDCYKIVLRVLRGMNNVPPPIEERYPEVLHAAEQATSWVLSNSREKENTLVRCFVAYKLHEEGYSYTEIGKIMRRDHSTITHLVFRMRDMLSLPNAYKFEVQQFKRFEELCG